MNCTPVDCGVSWIEHISSMVLVLNVHWNSFFEGALNDSSVETIFRLWDRVKDWILKAIRKSIPFKRSKKRSSTSLFLGHNSEVCLASILSFLHGMFPIVPFQKNDFLFGSNVCWEECGWLTGIYLPCSLSALPWTGAHCLSGSSGGKVLCSETERKHVHLDTHLFFFESASMCASEAENVKSLVEQRAGSISMFWKVRSPFFEGNIHLSYYNKKK